nr:unnamed protein product [Digitaria exilis]
MAGRLTDDLVEEILLSLAPDDPVSLVRAACPRWRRVVSTPGFRRGFAQRHRTAPMLGFFVNGAGTTTTPPTPTPQASSPPPASARAARTSAISAR